MKKVISFSLWGNDPLYWIGAVENIKLAKKLYPEWTCRFYIDEKSDGCLIDSILSQDCEVIFKKRKRIFSGLIWRFLAADDCDIMISRDADSRLSVREVRAVNEWLKSDKNFHIMRDHPQHNTFILGGMWGCRNLEGMTEILESIPENYQDAKGFDQRFLAQHIYPQIRLNAFIHDSYNHYGDGNDFPSRRNGDNFIGSVVWV